MLYFNFINDKSELEYGMEDRTRELFKLRKQAQEVKNMDEIEHDEVVKMLPISRTKMIMMTPERAAYLNRVEEAARKTVKYDCWDDQDGPDYHEKLCHGCECEWICQALNDQGENE